jgi:hypothetical protein
MTTTGSKGKPDPRKERLKAALRENLRRRKAQERGRGDATGLDAGDSPKQPVKEEQSR